jgi:prepilin-type N-terminal cleavage/methylation domain-containing protein
MMIFPHKTKIGSRGFTLLEIVIVLLVFALILGGAITTIVLTSSERALTNASGEIELLAKKARTASILHQKPYAIEFRENSVHLLPFAEASEIEQTTAMGNKIGGTAVGGSTGKTLREEITLDAEITLSVRRWNTENFVAPTKSFVPVWRFDPNGLSEPITVRMTIGESYAQDTYHPLTASIADSELEAK